MANNAEIPMEKAAAMLILIDPPLRKEIEAETKRRALPSLSSCIRTLLRESLAK